MQSIGSFDYYLAFKTKNKTRMKLLKGLDTLFKTLQSSFCIQFFKIIPGRIWIDQLKTINENSKHDHSMALINTVTSTGINTHLSCPPPQ